MNAESSNAKGSDHAKPPTSPSPSPLRLVILLGVLVVVVGALLYDKVVAPPRVKAAYDKLQVAAVKHNENGLKGAQKTAGDKNDPGKVGGLLYSADIQKVIGMGPTKTEKHELYTIEHYCWWGWIPRDGNYITVLYLGSPENPHYSTHYANMMPEDAAIPGKLKQAPPGEPSADAGKTPVAGRPGGMGAPGIAPPSMGPPGGGGGKGKGRPQGNGPKKGDESKGAEQGANQDDEPKTSDEPKKGVEPTKADEAKNAVPDDGEKKEPAKEAPKESK
jgi:hypothetical protein